MIMEKTYKRIPFDIELAKKIQLGEIEGRIVTDTKLPVKILCFDRKVPEYIVVGLVNGYSVFCYSKDGVSEPQPERITHTIYIELPEEAPKFKPFDKVLVRNWDNEIWICDMFSLIHEDSFWCIGGVWKHASHTKETSIL